MNYSFSVQAFCSANGDAMDPVSITNIDSSSPCHTIVSVSHKNACPVFSASSYTRFLVDRPFILSPLLILFGLAVTFYGR